MNWTEKSPGIYQAHHGGFVLTKILLRMKNTGRIDTTGRKVQEPEYSYIAAKPEPYTRFAGDLQKVLNQIAQHNQLPLFTT